MTSELSEERKEKGDRISPIECLYNTIAHIICKPIIFSFLKKMKPESKTNFLGQMPLAYKQALEKY
jgi:hypothetical protein